jgi:hypothetical protein
VKSVISKQNCSACAKRTAVAATVQAAVQQQPRPRAAAPAVRRDVRPVARVVRRDVRPVARRDARPAVRPPLHKPVLLLLLLRLLLL